MELLATTTPGLESVAAGELRDLVGATDTERHGRGRLTATVAPADVVVLNRWSRTCNRFGVVVVDDHFDGLDDLSALTRSVALDRFVAPDQSFGVDPTRHGDHEFGSPDVGDVVGQAVVDGVRAATGRAPTVDLDDPDVALLAYVHDDRFTLVADATGRSLHRRWYRVCEHDAPLRPTMAAAMVRLADPDPGEVLLDPTCGSGTIPVEAGLRAVGRSPALGREFADERLGVVPAGPEDRPTTAADRGRDGADREVRADHGDPDGPRPATVVPPGRVAGRDRQRRWVRCARENAGAAGLALEFAVGDIREEDAAGDDLDPDAVVANLPFGVRTTDDIRAVHAAVVDRARTAGARLVALTTRPDFLGVDPVERYEVVYGRLETAVVVADP